MRKFIISAFGSYTTINIRTFDILWLILEIVFSVLMYHKQISFLFFALSPVVIIMILGRIFGSYEKYHKFWNRSLYVFSLKKINFYLGIPIAMIIATFPMRIPILSIIDLVAVLYCLYGFINLYLAIKPMTMEEAPDLVSRYNIAVQRLPYAIMRNDEYSENLLFNIINEYTAYKHNTYKNAN